jgi:thiol-disulfide isomerase/thioredoxin
MSMRKCCLYLAAGLFCAASHALAQPKAPDGEFNYPEIGKECPDFTLNEIYNYSKSKASLQDFRGKWLILDFWTRGCSACISSFPKLNELTKEFRGKVQIVLVGNDDKLIRKMYEKFRQKYNLDLTTAYDSAIHRRFGIPSYPYIMWIDDKGMIRAITDKTDMTASNIQAFLNGENLKLPEKYGLAVREPKKAFDFEKPFLVDGNGGDDGDFIYRTLLTKWRRGMPVAGYSSLPVKRGKSRDEIFMTGVPLKMLYDIAFGDTISHQPERTSSYGSYWFEPVLELSDKSAFTFDAQTGENLYIYDMMMPPGKKKSELRQTMQHDLQNYFGYKVTIENRVMPYWKLVASDGAGEKLRSKGKHEKIGGDGHTSTILTDEPMSRLIRILWGKNPLGPPIIDETGINHNISIKIEAVLSDLDDVKKSLQKSGLDLVKSQKEMKVIVIRDKN